MSENNQSDISLLFARDPLSLTKQDRSVMIAYFRENREKYIASATRAVAPKEPKSKIKGPIPNIDLGDLEL